MTECPKVWAPRSIVRFPRTIYLFGKGTRSSSILQCSPFMMFAHSCTLYMSSIKYLHSNLRSQKKKYSLNVQFQINSLKLINFKLNVWNHYVFFLKTLPLQMNDRQNKLSQTQVRIFVNKLSLASQHDIWIDLQSQLYWHFGICNL